jgi:drug/metabolite transporter (DMT)-like permease
MVGLHVAAIQSSAPGLPFIRRICLFAAAGALFSLPFAIAEAITEPHRVASWHALGVYLFAGIVPGILAYGGFAWLDARFGSVRTCSCSMSGRWQAPCFRSSCLASRRMPSNCWAAG